VLLADSRAMRCPHRLFDIRTKCAMRQKSDGDALIS
jgi:hypothetical protein